MSLRQAHRIHVQQTAKVLSMEIANKTAKQVVDLRQIAEAALPITPQKKPKQLLESRK